MKKIKEYKLVDEERVYRLNTEISSLIRAGFQPFGKLYIYTTEHGIPRFAQVMVTYEEPR